MFYFSVIGVIVGEVFFVFDGFLSNLVSFDLFVYYIDIGGVLDYVFVLFYFLGMMFVLCLCDFFDWWLVCFGSVKVWFILVFFIGKFINEEVIW